MANDKLNNNHQWWFLLIQVQNFIIPFRYNYLNMKEKQGIFVLNKMCKLYLHTIPFTVNGFPRIPSHQKRLVSSLCHFEQMIALLPILQYLNTSCHIVGFERSPLHQFEHMTAAVIRLAQPQLSLSRCKNTSRHPALSV